MNDILESRRRFARVLMIVLGAALLASLISIVYGFLDRGALVNAVADGIGHLQESQGLFMGLVVLLMSTGIFIAGAVLFLLWVYRANKSGRILGAAAMEFTPGWAVGWFLIPIANFYYPIKVMQEIWRTSDPQADLYDSTSWILRPGTAVITIWWIVILLSRGVKRVADHDIPWMIVGDAFTALTVLLTLIIVVRIERRFEERERIASQYEDMPTETV